MRADKLKEFSLSCVSIVEIQKTLLISISNMEEQIILQWCQTNVSMIFDVLSVRWFSYGLYNCLCSSKDFYIFVTFLFSPPVLQMKENLHRRFFLELSLAGNDILIHQKFINLTS